MMILRIIKPHVGGKSSSSSPLEDSVDTLDLYMDNVQHKILKKKHETKKA